MVSLGEVWEAKLRFPKPSNPIFELFKSDLKSDFDFKTIFDPKNAPKTSQNDSKMDSNMVQKSVPKDVRFQAPFCIDF